MNNSWYKIENSEDVASPALLVWPDRVEQNIRRMVEIVEGHVEHLRPHVKTHKLPQVLKMQLAAGITRCKVATIAEMEMAADAGVPDILLAYQPVGPNIRRLLALHQKYPEVRIAALTDDPNIVDTISSVFSSGGATLALYLDIDCGMHRTGIEVGEAAADVCRRIAEAPAVEFAGLHVYDGHVHDVPVEDRESNSVAAFEPVLAFLRVLRDQGTPVKNIVGGGSPTFGVHARRSLSEEFSEISYECSPGTTLFWDAGMTLHFPDLGFVRAAAVLTRVVSKPLEGRLCLDLGHKSVSAENPIEDRVRFDELPDAKPLIQNEEHLMLETSRSDEYSIGDALYGIPWHICPTVALHQEAVIIRDGRATGERWEIRARGRRLTV